METSIRKIFEDTVRMFDGFIPISIFCDKFKINYDHQVEIIKNDPILKLQTEKKRFELLFGNKRKKFSLPPDGFLRWLTIINAKIVDISIREKFIEVQKNAVEFFCRQKFSPKHQTPARNRSSPKTIGHSN